jgi:UPF0716 protein FxsA
VQRFLAVAAVVAVLEFVVIVEVAVRLGVVDTLGLLILVSVVGGLIVKAQGVAVLRRALGDVQSGRVPGATLADGALVVVAGVLLLVPGFITDVPALLLLLPPVRRGVRRGLRRRWSRRGYLIVRGDELEA